MQERNGINRRSVLKTVGAGVFGGTVFSGTAGAHGGDLRLPAWFETQIWELGAYPPEGEEPTDDSSHAPIWHIAPGADGQQCPQVWAGILPNHVWHNLLPDSFEDGAWAKESVSFDHTMSAFPFSTLWHIHWVFDRDAYEENADGDLVPKGDGLTPSDLVNQASDGTPLTSGSRIRNAAEADEVVVEDVQWVFNCPIRPNQGDHYVFC